MKSRRLAIVIAAILFGAMSADMASAWGCVARGSDGGYGYSYNWPSEQDAELTALNKCEENSTSGDCSTEVCTRDEGG
ncbi:DUF4189 domain-containing protein [Rhizobium sp.]